MTATTRMTAMDWCAFARALFRTRDDRGGIKRGEWNFSAAPPLETRAVQRLTKKERESDARRFDIVS